MTTTTTTHEFLFANMGSGPNDFEVHSPKCGDLRRKHARGERINSTWRVQADTPEAAVASEVADFEAQDQDWPVESFKIFPCCVDNAAVVEVVS